MGMQIRSGRIRITTSGGVESEWGSVEFSGNPSSSIEVMLKGYSIGFDTVPHAISLVTEVDKNYPNKVNVQASIDWTAGGGGKNN